MAEKMRPTYGGVPKAAEAQIAARRERAGECQVATPAPAPQPRPALIETRLKAIEEKVDLIIEILQAGATSADPPTKPTPRAKR